MRFAQCQAHHIDSVFKKDEFFFTNLKLIQVNYFLQGVSVKHKMFNALSLGKLNTGYNDMRVRKFLISNFKVTKQTCNIL